MTDNNKRNQYVDLITFSKKLLLASYDLKLGDDLSSNEKIQEIIKESLTDKESTYTISLSELNETLKNFKVTNTNTLKALMSLRKAKKQIGELNNLKNKKK